MGKNTEAAAGIGGSKSPTINHPQPTGHLQPPSSNLQPPTNIVCLPYQPLSALAGSLSAADLHVVVMGEPFVGIVHPCKIYNVLAVCAPVLYLGPRPNHVTEILDAMGD